MSIYAGLTVMLPNDGVRFAASQRLNLMLTDGSKIELFGDVLTPGKDAELAAAIQVAIDAMGTRDMTDADKVELKAIMSAEAAQKNLAKTFLLSDRGISFGAPGFSNLFEACSFAGMRSDPRLRHQAAPRLRGRKSRCREGVDGSPASKAFAIAWVFRLRATSTGRRLRDATTA